MIAANRTKFLKAKRAQRKPSDKSSSDESEKFDSQGRPLKQNKKGVFVVDQRKLRDQQQAALISTLTELEKSVDNDNKTDTSSDPPTPDTGTGTPEPLKSAFRIQLERAQQQVSNLYSSYRN